MSAASGTPGQLNRALVELQRNPSDDRIKDQFAELLQGAAIPQGRLAAEASWRDYEAALEGLPDRSPWVTARTQKFASLGYHFGNLPVELARTAAAAIHQAERRYMQASDSTLGFATEDYSDERIKHMNLGSHFRNLHGLSASVVADILDFIKNEVAECLGSPWRTVNVRAWSTPPKAVSFGMYAWHMDGHVPEIFKIMIYLTPLSDDTGAIDFRIGQEIIRHRSSEPGGWVLFRNSAIEHRGAPGERSERLAVEITLSRAAAFDVRLRFPGLNAHWPLAPWIDVLDESRPKIALAGAERKTKSTKKAVRRFAVRIIEGGLQVVAPLTPAAARAIEPISPRFGAKLRGIHRRSKEKTLFDVAEQIVNVMTGKV